VDPESLSTFLFNKSYDGSPLGSCRSIHISRAGAKVKKQSFQAGGTVSALIHFALRSKRIRGSVLTGHDIKNALLPVPSLVTRPAEVFRRSLSKYAAAPTLAVLNRAAGEGLGNLGVVATPCQATAIAQMRLNPLDDPSFKDPTALVIGLFCTWALDFRKFEEFLAQRLSIVNIIKVDIPPPPAAVLQVYLKEGVREFPLDEIRTLVPEACGYCPDMTSEFADVSVGVLEDRPEMNTLIVRTERGEEIVRAASRLGYLELDDMPKENLDHLLWAAANKKKRGVLRCRETGRLNGEEGRACLRIKDDVVETILGNGKEAQSCHS
jgi:coenzyme F420 hydrogenase subunit beta